MRFCIVCKQEIDPDRIDVIPETRLCTEHAKEIQNYGGEFVVSSSQELTSKQGSLKLNYGGVTTKSTRNHVALEQLMDAYELKLAEETGPGITTD